MILLIVIKRGVIYTIILLIRHVQIIIVYIARATGNVFCYVMTYTIVSKWYLDVIELSANCTCVVFVLLCTCEWREYL